MITNKKISFIIPVLNNFKYTKAIYENITSYFPEDEIIISDGGSTDETLDYFSKVKNPNLLLINNGPCNNCENINAGALEATTDYLVFLHNDMFVPSNFKSNLLEDIQHNTILSYTRVEPPIFPQEHPGKVVKDFGNNLDTFNKKDFELFASDYNLPLQEGGSQLFISCYKSDWIGLDETTFVPPQMWAADDDLHLRFNIKGLEKKVSKACVYHFVSKTSRQGNYQEGERQSNFNFVKKWGFRKSHFNIVYNKKVIVKNNKMLKDQLSIWFNDGKDIIVEVDENTFTQQDFTYIQQLNDIIKDTNQLGTFTLGNIKIIINSLKENQDNFIFYG